MIRVGCSGWNYKHWRGPVYPPGLPMRSWFEHYATLFDTVEINNSFYRLPEPSTFASWRQRAPQDFLYAIKGSRFLTHLKRLRDPEEPVVRLFEHARELGDRFGPVLYQLPGNFHRDLPRLDGFLSVLPRTLGEIGGSPKSLPLRHVIEFRHPSWYDDATYDVLRRRGVALCLHDKAGSAIDSPLVGPFVYARFHGPGVGTSDVTQLRACNRGSSAVRTGPRRARRVRILQQRSRGHGRREWPRIEGVSRPDRSRMR